MAAQHTRGALLATCRAHAACPSQHHENRCRSGPGHAEISTWGYHDDGSFKGLALFRMRRIGAAEESAQLDALRARFAVGYVMDSRPR